MLESLIKGFWSSDDALAWKDGNLLKMMKEAVVSLNFSVAKVKALPLCELCYDVTCAPLRALMRALTSTRCAAEGTGAQ